MIGRIASALVCAALLALAVAPSSADYLSQAGSSLRYFKGAGAGSDTDPIAPSFNSTVETGSVVTIGTASANGADQTNYNGRGLHCVVDITAITGTNIVFTIQGKDSVSGKYYTLLASAALTGTGTTVLKVYPGLTAAANTVVSDILPRTWRVITTNTAISAITATAGCSVVN